MSKTSIVSSGIGCLVRDVTLKDVGNTKVAELCLVFNEVYGKDENGQPRVNSSFMSFEAWDTAAEYLANNSCKGDRIFFEATPRQDKWSKDGQQRERIVFRINKFIILNKPVSQFLEEKANEQK